MFKTNVPNICCWTLCRWDVSKPAAVDNLVLMTFEEADQHDGEGATDQSDAQASYSMYVQQRLQLIRTEYDCN